MSAKYSDIRSALDELMGSDRNLLPTEKRKTPTHYSEPNICKLYLCGLCPHFLFTNTKSDLGPCDKQHDDTCKDMYAKDPEKWRYPYEREFVRYLQKIVDDLDKRIKKGLERLSHQQPEIPLTAVATNEIDMISERTELLLKEMEKLAEEGKVSEAQARMDEINKLKIEKEQVLKGATGMSVSQQEKRLQVCEICGAFLVIGDTERRTASHLEGKQHQGYLLIRNTLDDKLRMLADREREMDRNREYDADRRDRAPRGRDSRDDRDRNRYRDRDRGRDYRDRDRDRRDRDRGYRDRDREYRDRDRDYRDRDRDRDYRDRDRDRDREYRDRDRDGGRRKRERDRDEEGEEERQQQPQQEYEGAGPTEAKKQRQEGGAD